MAAHILFYIALGAACLSALLTPVVLVLAGLVLRDERRRRH